MNILITGAAGMLATAMIDELRSRAHEVTALTRAQLDVEDAAAVTRVLRETRPAVVVQCAAYTRVDDAEREEAHAFAVNALATAHVAEACADIGARLVYPSTDYVFDGTAARPYARDAATAPINAYGRSKLAGEHAARRADALVVRTSWLYGSGGRNFVRTVLARARAGQPLRVVDDQRGTPTWTADLARTIALLLERAAPAGTYHATNSGDTTWYGLACAALDICGLDTTISPVATSAFPTPARRPAYSVLDCTSTWAVTGTAPHWRDALTRALHSQSFALA